MRTFKETSPTSGRGQRARLHVVLAMLVGLASGAPSAAVPPVRDPGAGPDEDVALTPPGRFHGSWRVTAQEDPHDAALMAVALMHDAADDRVQGDYALFQPFCDAVAGRPIRGDEDCELDGGGVFESARRRGDWLVLVFRPTADGRAHLLVLRPLGDALAGVYRSDDVNVPVIARPILP